MSDEKDTQTDSGAAPPDQEAQPVEAPLYSLLAEYDTPGALIAASKKVREAGYRHWDTFTPFPVHGIERAMGIKMTRLPWIVLCAGLTGLTTAIVLQWWTNAVDYPWIVSGKPFWSIPANVPIMFELTVLFSAFAALFGMLAMNNLPLPSHPLDLKQRFAKVTDNKFFLMIEARDPKFDEQETHELLAETHPTIIEDVLEDRESSDKMPPVVVYGLIVLAVASLAPFALFAKARETKSDNPRIHAVWDMDFQPYYKAQDLNPLFEDKRAMRTPPEGTIPVGGLRLDDHLYRGMQGGALARVFPEQIEPNAQTMARGKERFEIFCAPCHGLTGEGDGPVHQRAESLQEGTWIQPTNLQQQHIREQPVGQLFNAITNGIRNMPPYGHQIDAEDRWAIVMYLRALQRSRAATLADVSETERGALK